MVAVAVATRTVVVPMVIMVVVRRLSRLVVALMPIVAGVVVAFVIAVVVALMFVDFRHVFLRLFIESHLASGCAEIICRSFVFALPTRRVVGIHVHLADRVYRCSHVRLLQVIYSVLVLDARSADYGSIRPWPAAVSGSW
jgi:hypothetical protein